MDGVTHDYGSVLASLSHYFNALHMRDAAAMRRVWHQDCHLKRPSGDGEVVDIDADTFMSIVAGKDIVPGAEVGKVSDTQHLGDTVQSIQFTSQSMAMAKVLITLGDNTYTDFLALLKLNDGWRIVAKLFTSRNAGLPYAFDTTPLASAHGELGRVASAYVDARREANGNAISALFHPCAESGRHRHSLASPTNTGVPRDLPKDMRRRVACVSQS